MHKVTDITLTICVRLTEFNPWVLERISLQSQLYNPRPKILILDFGSEKKYRKLIKAICLSNSVDYHYVADNGIYSNGIARNKAFDFIETDLIFFTDVDCIMRSDFFGTLSLLANELDIGRNSKQFLNLPVYHFSESATKEIIRNTDDTHKFNSLITQYSLSGIRNAELSAFEFIAPYSNIFLCHRNFFELSGGYAEDFRGHGSVDFEFLIRICLLFKYYPEPFNLLNDEYGPLQYSYFKYKEYSGFRRMFELLAFTSESLGLKTFHLWHPKPVSDEWQKKNDVDRSRFKSVLGRYVTNRVKILDEDYLKRDKRALCLFSNNEQFQYFLPFRLYGYRLSTIEKFNKAVQEISSGYFERLFVCDIDHLGSESSKLLDLARKQNIKITRLLDEQKRKSLDFIDEKEDRNLGYAQYSVRNDSHESKTVSVDFISFEDKKFSIGLGDTKNPFSWQSYMAGHLNTGPLGKHFPEKATFTQRLFKRYRILRLTRKLVTKPRLFFADSRKKGVLSKM